jgi:hypothetical protein
MAIVKTYNQQVDAYGGSDVVQTLTQASTATRVNRHGTTVITSAGSGTVGTHGFVMDTPSVGIRKTIIVDPNSTRTVTVFNASTADTFLSSTGNSLVFSTGAGVKAVTLVGISTAQWAIVSQTTGVTPTASTVSA